MVGFEVIILVLVFFTIALIYSSIGFGGGSSYTAVLAMTALPHTLIPQVSLLCNIVVVSGGVWIFYRGGRLNLRKALPIVAAGIPMAFLGGSIPVQKEHYFLALALALIVSSWRLIFWAKGVGQEGSSLFGGRAGKRAFSVAAGAFVGFFSGLVGIGGGVILAPLLHHLRWDTPRAIAAVSSFFILANSISGLLGQLGKGGFEVNADYLLPLGGAVFLGGQIGSRLGAGVLPEEVIRRLTGVLVFAVGLKLLIGVFAQNS